MEILNVLWDLISPEGAEIFLGGWSSRKTSSTTTSTRILSPTSVTVGETDFNKAENALGFIKLILPRCKTWKKTKHEEQQNILVKERACHLGENSWSIAFWATFLFLFQTYNLLYAAFPEKLTWKPDRHMWLLLSILEILSYQLIITSVYLAKQLVNNSTSIANNK